MLQGIINLAASVLVAVIAASLVGAAVGDASEQILADVTAAMAAVRDR